MKTMKSPSTTTPTAGGRGFRMIAIFSALVLVIAVVGGWLLLRGDDKTAADHLEDVATEMRNGDMDKLAEIFGLDDTESSEYRFVEWHIGWDARPEFSDVVESGADRTRFTATVTYDDDAFYSQALGRTLTTTVSGYLTEEGTLEVTSWPPPNGLTTVEGELRTWVDANRPELFDEMFGDDFSGMRWSRRSGELRIEVLDDFLAVR